MIQRRPQRFAKTRSSHEVCSLGLGCVPNEPVQKLAQVRICTLLAKLYTAIRTLLANLQNLYVQALLAKYQIIQGCIACQVVNMGGNVLLAG